MAVDEDQFRPKFTSESYHSCYSCGAHCMFGLESDAEHPCWGEVMYQDETECGDILHACEGHIYVHPGDMSVITKYETENRGSQ